MRWAKVIAAFLLLCLTGPAFSIIARPTRTVTLTLKSERRDVPVTVVVPGGGTSGQWRGGIMLFSHDIGSNPSQYALLLEDWAERTGFIVIAPLHADSNDRTAPSRASLSAWNSRLADMKLIANSMPQLANAAGHSFDGMTPKVLAGHGLGALVAETLHGDSVVAVMAWSPPGPLPSLPTPVVTKPLLTITGTADITPGMAATWQDRLAAHNVAKAPAAAYVGKGADHYFGRIIGKTDQKVPPQGAQFMEALELSSLFLNAYANFLYPPTQAQDALKRFRPKSGSIMRR